METCNLNCIFQHEGLCTFSDKNDKDIKCKATCDNDLICTECGKKEGCGCYD
ncbi:unnamed protein product [marine sediment metagenome]|uniref:DUF1540 domain-containing protein n=1 Tax=marine sediment metagenome TaxID=412755 RepID=X0WAA6_9ZZZZ